MLAGEEIENDGEVQPAFLDAIEALQRLKT